MALITSSSSPTGFYHVFLSFRGEDTRMGFVAHLYKELDRRGLSCFKDDKKLERGKSISPELFKATQMSRFAIVVISPNYASSSWCLDELAQILDCNQTFGLSVLPIFYQVDPSHVENQTGCFAEPFVEHEMNFELHKVQMWRSALTKVALIAGWDSRNRSEPEIIEEVAEVILKKSKRTSSNGFHHLVGINSRVDKIIPLLCFESIDVCFVGIWGMVGIGKTTYTEALYHQISNRFEICYFVANVREKSLKYTEVGLRDKMFYEILEGKSENVVGSNILPGIIKDKLHKKKVLIVLDDVSNFKQLNTLVGDRDWFGPGSRVIITSRDKQVLLQKADKIYEVKGLCHIEALQLFSWYAFKQSHPCEDYLELSKMVLDYAEGVPLALKVLGSLLYKKDKREWESILQKLEQYPNLEIQNALRVSYTELNKQEKHIFLDVACFFKGKNRDWVENILDICGFSTRFGISRLIDKCLIIEKEKKLEMHGLLQKMGWDISIEEPFDRRRRFWIPGDIQHILTSNTETGAIEGIFLDISQLEELDLCTIDFSRMHNLRLLKIFNSLSWAYDIMSNDFHSLPNKLVYLHWHRYPWNSLPSSFSLENLVELNLPCSRIKQLWEGVKHLQKLKLLDLHSSKLLTTLPDLSSAVNLERIILDECESLLEIHPSIQCLQKLVYLSLFGCIGLSSFPSLIHLTSLRTLDLSCCPNLNKFPEIPKDIEKLYLYGTGLKEWPPSIQFNSLETLDFSYHNLKKFPNIIGNVKYLDLRRSNIEELPLSIKCLSLLVKLDLKGCEKLTGLPSSIGELKFLETINLSDCFAIKQLPSSIGGLTSLVEMNLKGCSRLESLPSTIYGLKCLKILNLLGCSAIRELPSSIWGLSSLVELHLQECKCLEILPSTNFDLMWLKKLNLFGCSRLGKLPPVYGLFSLTELDISDCGMQEIPRGLCRLSSLQRLYMKGNDFDMIPESIKQLSLLKILDIRWCRSLQFLPELPGQIKEFRADACTSLKNVSGSSSITLIEMRPWENVIHEFSFANCVRLNKNAFSKITADAQLKVEHMSAALLRLSNRNVDVGILFRVNLPGSRVPEWFSYQCTGNSISIRFPLQVFMGLAVCAVVKFEDDYYSRGQCHVRCRCHFRNICGVSHDMDLILHSQTGMMTYKSDHVFLCYENRISCNDDKTWKYDWLRENASSISEASFEFCAFKDRVGNNLLPLKFKVKKCGFHPVFVQGENLCNPTEVSINYWSHQPKFWETIVGN